MFGVWNLLDVEYLGCEMFGRRNVCDAGCLKCRILGMWDTGDVKCWDVVCWGNRRLRPRDVQDAGC